MVESPPSPISLVRLQSHARPILFMAAYWPPTMTCEEAEEHAEAVLEMVRTIRAEQPE
jgi:hypothetical protein